jgi:serine/threonine protein phosphatase PrpC
MSQFETTSVTVPYRSRCEDRVAILPHDDRLVIAVADGAGGSGGGAEAADTVIREVTGAASEPRNAASWSSVLQQIDCRIGCGESTCVLIELSGDNLCGASVGDSTAWLVHDGQLVDLTQDQVRKPLLGSGRSQPVGFSNTFSRGLLIVATDGFSKYVKRDVLLKEVLWLDFVVLARRLVEMVRLPSGELWDDVGIVACRRRPASRKRYALLDAT